MSEVVKVFLSSTEIDMQEHRQKVLEALLRLGHLPVMMESFGAVANTPVEVCKGKVMECDALVVMIAHRYGWAPSVDDGGDGKKSITWIEVETALANGIPVFAFIVDVSFPWSLPKEQDLLASAKSCDDALKVFTAVQSLKEFKTFIDTKSGLTRDKFTTPENLSGKVATSLQNLDKPNNHNEKSEKKGSHFEFRIVHALQPAPHFRGRKQLLNELKTWWHDIQPINSVISLIAIGGTGKTAIIENFLNYLGGEPLKGSVFVWSFYDEPNTDSFLKEACVTFSGKEPDNAGSALGVLQRALKSDSGQNLIVLDGLELIQSEGRGNSLRSKGDLEDPRIKNLLRTVAKGLGMTRVLITSRFELTDLEQWGNKGYLGHKLDFLDVETAIAVLRAWSIKGNDAKLEKLAVAVGYHALSVSVIGSYLNHYCNCEPDGISEFDLDEVAEDEPQAAKLARILAGYARSLPNQDRDLIIRLSVFPKGISSNILTHLIEAGGEIAGTLVGVSQHRLNVIIENLKRQGLIYSYKRDNGFVYTSHPFLRDYFKSLLGVSPENIHKKIKDKLVIGLEERPLYRPTNPGTLNRYEAVIEHSVLAGNIQEAYDIYESSMGGAGGRNNLFHILGDYGRITRIVSLFSEDGTPNTLTDILSEDKVSFLSDIWGIAATALGDLKTANLCFNYAFRCVENKGNFIYAAQYLQDAAWMNIHSGNFFSAKKLLTNSLEYIKQAKLANKDVYYLELCYYSYMAYVLHALGDNDLAKNYFAYAQEIHMAPLKSIPGFFQAMHMIDIGSRAGAFKLIKENLVRSEREAWYREIGLCHFLLGLLTMDDSILRAKEHHKKLDEWVDKSGYMESIIHSCILAAEIACHSGEFKAAFDEAITGFDHTESCGFGKLAIDLLLLLAKINIAVLDYTNALSYARQAYDRAAHPDAGNAWGQANGLHLMGVCHKALAEYALAQQCLEETVKLREKIEHPEVEETRKLLAELPK